MTLHLCEPYTFLDAPSLQVETLAKQAVHTCPWESSYLLSLGTAALMQSHGKASAANCIARYMCKTAPAGDFATLQILQLHFLITS